MTNRILTALPLLSSLLLSACGAGQSKTQSPPPQAEVPADMDFSTCPWPVKGTVDAATVRMRVLVAPDGSARGTEVLSAEPPDQGFGERAEECALKKTFVPGRLPNGDTEQSWTAPFRIDFAR